MSLPPRHAFVLVTMLLAACQPAPTAIGRHATSRPVLVAASPAPSAVSPTPVARSSAASPSPAVLANGPATTPASAFALFGAVQLPANIIANNGAGLLGDTGLGLVSNNGSGIIANNGGGVIANHGAGYHLQSLAQQGLTGALVELYGADGKPLAGADGKPLQARTDATGHYGFPAAPSGQALVVVTLPGSLGRLQAIAPRGAHREADLELVSTLTTTYILDQYVKGQADPVAVLAKLPDDVEAATRARASAAIAASAFTPPDALVSDKLVAAVDKLRGADHAFDGQMETVKQLLVVAGQQDLGNGLPALQVALAGIKDLAVGPGGEVYFESLAGNEGSDTNVPTTRLWRLGTDGKLVAVAGNGQTILTGGAEVADGASALDVGCHGGVALGVDKAGRPMFITDLDKVYRVQADGKLQLLYDANMGFPVVGWVGTDATAEAVVLGENNTLLMVDAPGKTHPLATLGAIPADAHVFGRDANGRFYAATAKGVQRIDPTTGQQTLVAGSDTAAGLGLAPDGQVLEQGTDGKLELVRPDGNSSVVADTLPAGFRLALDPVAVALDGMVYLVQGGQRVFRLRAGTLEAVAGQPGGAATGVNAALVKPTSFDVAADGTLYVADAGVHQILKVTGTGQTTVYAGSGVATADGGDGGTALAASFGDLIKLRRGPDGALYLLESDGKRYWLRRIAADGTVDAPWSVPDGPRPAMAVGSDGRVLVAAGTQYWLGTGAGPYTVIAGTDVGIALSVLDVEADPSGGFLVMASGNLDGSGSKVYHYGGKGPARMDTGFDAYPDATQGGVDPTGRYFFPRLNPNSFVQEVVRVGADGTLVSVAGKGGTVLNGDQADSFLSDPVDVRFDAAGNMYVLDAGARQVKKVAAAAIQ